MSNGILLQRVFSKKEAVPGGVQFTARVGILGSAKSLLLGTVVLFATGAIFSGLDNGPTQNRDERMGVLYFLCLLLGCGIAVFLHGVTRFRNRLNVLILNEKVVAVQIGLLKRKVTWIPKAGESYYLIVPFRDHEHLQAGDNDGDNMRGRQLLKRPKVRVASLDIVDGNAKRHRLLRKFNGWMAILELTQTMSETLRLPPPVFINLDESADEETAYRDAHLNQKGIREQENISK